MSSPTSSSPIGATSTTSTTSNSRQSPKPIPPRRSSTNHHSIGHSLSTSSSSRGSVLHPVPEACSSNSAVSHHIRSSPPPHPKRLRRASLPPSSFLAKMAQPPQRPDPSRFAYEDFNFIAGRRSQAADKDKDKDKVILGPFDYLNSQRGKDFRSQLIAAFNSWLDVPPESIEIITKVVGMLHTASLLIDDVEDSSLLRRGLPVAHSLFGVPQTINSANYVYFCALEEVQKLGNPQCISVFADELLNLHRGQGMELFWRDTLTCPTEDEYLEMVGNKTGGLFKLGIKLMQAESRSAKPVECVPLVSLIGLIFQIRDDYQNLHSTEYSDNKGLAEDLTEGKFSFPVIHSIRYDPGNLQLINILKQRTTDGEVKRYAIKYMDGTGSFEYTRKVLDILIERARKVADKIDLAAGWSGRNAGIAAILDRMVIDGSAEMWPPAKAE